VEGLCNTDTEGYECRTDWILVEHGDPTDLTPYFNQAESNLIAKRRTKEEREASQREWEALENLVVMIRDEIRDNTSLGIQIRGLMKDKIS